MKIKHATQSIHPALQAMLPRIGQYTAHEWRPIFKEREEAEEFLVKMRKEEGHEGLELNAVWAINHIDLTGSRIVGWSVVELIN
jgi:hypothetical protein